jgi:mono/diheme cytochrome c family protein
MWNRLPAAALAGLLLIIGLAWRFIEAQPKPEANFGVPLVDVRVPKLQGAALEGEALFNDKCASCHGGNAAGREGVAPPLVHRIYAPDHHADGSFLLATMKGVRAHHWPFGDMPPVPGIKPEEIGKIVAYVRTLQKANGIF